MLIIVEKTYLKEETHQLYIVPVNIGLLLATYRAALCLPLLNVTLGTKEVQRETILVHRILRG